MAPTAEIFVLAAAFVGLALWVNLFKLSSPRWRFEFFSIDFTVGALLMAALGAFTLGNLGTDLSFGDRLLVASKTSQALVFFGGGVFGLGILTLLAATRLLGIAAAFTLALSLAGFIVSGVTVGSSSLLISGICLALLVAALLMGGKAARDQDSPLPPPKRMRQPVRFTLRRSTKGILLAVASGLFFGTSIPTSLSGMSGDFGLGPYAGLLMLTVGALLAAVFLSLFLLNISIDLPPGSLRGYWSRQPSPAGSKGQHRYGLLAGAIWAGGTLAYLTQRLALGKAHDPASNAAAVAGLIVATLCGIVVWQERKLTKSPLALLGGVLLFTCGALLSVWGHHA